MDEIDRQFVTLLPPAAGLLALGTLSILFGRAAFAWRLAAAGLTTALGYALVSAAYDGSTHAAYPLIVVAVTAVAVTAAGIGPISAWLRTPLGYGTALVTAGTAGLLGSYQFHEQAAAQAEERDAAAVSLLNYVPDRLLVPNAHLVTDRGAVVPVYRSASSRTRTETDGRAREATAGRSPTHPGIQRQPADEDVNCHGWVFTGGRYIIPNSSVDQILTDNGYAAVPTAAPGDVVVYRNLAGEVIHTAVVRYVAPGRVPMVEGKWGWLGVYLHAADECSYGPHFSFYRSHRDGDLLKGISGSTGVSFTGAE